MTNTTIKLDNIKKISSWCLLFTEDVHLINWSWHLAILLLDFFVGSFVLNGLSFKSLWVWGILFVDDTTFFPRDRIRDETAMLFGEKCFMLIFILWHFRNEWSVISGCNLIYIYSIDAGAIDVFAFADAFHFHFIFYVYDKTDESKQEWKSDTKQDWSRIYFTREPSDAGAVFFR